MQETKYFLEWKTFLPSWSIALVIISIILFVYWCYRHETAISSFGIKLVLGLLRALILLGLFAIICEPVWHEIVEKIQKPSLIFLIDNSMSMKNRDHYPYETSEALKKTLPNIDISQISRIQIAQELLKNSKKISQLHQQAKIKFYQFSDDYAQITSLEQLDAEGNRTDIYNNLIKTVDAFAGENIAAVFVLSDGQHNTHPNPSDRDRIMQQTITHLIQKDNTKVYTVGIGSTEKRKDLIVTGLDAPEFALMDDRVRFDVEILNHNYPEGKSVQIELRWGERLLSNQRIVLKNTNQAQKESLFHTFTQEGEYNLSVRIFPDPEEITIENNVRTHTIKIIKQQFRVLYIEDIPRWEYRYLKNAMLRDGTVKVNTWLISADGEFPQDKSKDAPNLTQQPTRQDLTNYDCLILGDVSFSKLGKEMAAGLAEFVQEGGGLIFIAGIQNSLKNYNDDANLKALLPVQLPRIIDEERNFENEQRFRLTPEGQVHPILRLTTEIEQNSFLWERELPGFYWSYPVERAKPGATVLITHQESNTPLVVTQVFGKGRTFFCGIDSTWRWRKPLPSDGYLMNPDRYFYRFWGQVIRYVAMGKLLGSGRQCFLRVDNSQYPLGEKIRVSLTIRDPRQDKPPQEMEIFHLEPGGEKKSKKMTISESDASSLETSFLATQLGEHKLWFMDDGKEIQTTFQVVPSQAEAGDLELNEKDLQELAKKTGGEYIKPENFEESLAKKLIIQSVRLPQSISEKPYWDYWWWLVILIILWTIEWILRKIYRMT